MDIKAVIHLGRFKDIIMTLFRYGFDDVVERLNLPGKIVFEKIRKVDRQMSTWERVRYMLVDLGPTYIKFGQIMSLRPDLMPEPLILELRKLQDEVEPVEFEAVKEVVEQNLQKPLSEVFSFFDEQPLAAASLAQVHRAVLRDIKQVVAVKVQRPEIRQIIENDFYILEVIANQLDEHTDWTEAYDLPGVVQEVKKTLMRELDFEREARHMVIGRGNLAEVETVYVPAVFDSYCTEQVLTMELVEGIKMKDLKSDASIDREALAKSGLQLTIKLILEDGFFHADPHPGNVFVLDKNIYCLLDWGMVGHLTRRTRYELIDLINAVVEKDTEKIEDILVKLTGADSSAVPRSLERQILDILETFHSVPIQELNLGQLLLDLSTMLRENRLKLPVDLAIMIKALITAEGAARELYPELNVVEEAKPYVKQLALERWKPKILWSDLRRNFSALWSLQRELPQHLRQIIEKIDRGELNIRFYHENVDGLRSTFENITNRLTFGIIIAALIIGSSMIITTGVKPLLFGFPALGIIGYLVSGVFGLWLIINIIRSRKF